MLWKRGQTDSQSVSLCYPRVGSHFNNTTAFSTVYHSAGKPYFAVCLGPHSGVRTAAQVNILTCTCCSPGSGSVVFLLPVPSRQGKGRWATALDHRDTPHCFLWELFIKPYGPCRDSYACLSWCQLLSGECWVAYLTPRIVWPGPTRARQPVLGPLQCPHIQTAASSVEAPDSSQDPGSGTECHSGTRDVSGEMIPTEEASYQTPNYSHITGEDRRHGVQLTSQNLSKHTVLSSFSLPGQIPYMRHKE